MKGPVCAIILAAGYSSRMGAFKPLLPFGRATVLEHVVSLFRGAGIRDIRVVVGHNHAALQPLLQKLQVRAVLNERYHEGMFSSVAAAVETLESSSGAFLLLPVDIPMVRRRTVELLLARYRSSAAGIIYPACGGKRGHPPLIANTYRDSILSWDGDGGLKTLLMKHEEDAETIETGDSGVLLDMDTEEDYRKLVKILQKASIPSSRICEQLLLEMFAADSPVVAHSRAVAKVALMLASRLNAGGCRMDLELLEAASLLHDLAKGRLHHAEIGAAMLRGLGYDAVAGLVAVHMELPDIPGDDLSEAALLYLADKLLDGTRLVPLENRFRFKLEHYADQPAVLEKITARLEQARAIQRSIESRLGQPINDILMEFN